MLKVGFIIHPIYLLVLLAGIACGHFFMVIYGIIAVLLHELAHYSVAKRYGYKLNKMCLMPYGAMLYGAERIGVKESAIIAFAGPICNLILAAFCVASWWFFPNTYPYTEEFFEVNLSLFLVNLIPVFPLDGGKIVLLLFKDSKVGAKKLRKTGALLGVAFFVTSIISVFYKFNLSLGIFGLTLFVGAFTGNKDMQYITISSIANANKRTDLGVVARKVFLNDDVKLQKVLKWIDDEHYTDFIILLNKPQNDCDYFTLSEKEMADIIANNSLNEKLSRVLSMAVEAQINK